MEVDDIYREAIYQAGAPTIAAAPARFSIAFVVATAPIHGSVRLAAFSAERFADPGIHALMARIHLHIDPWLDVAFPGQRAAQVTFEIIDGRRAAHLQPTRKDDPDQPLTDAAVTDKFLELVAPILGDVRTNTLLQRLWRLDGCRDIADL